MLPALPFCKSPCGVVGRGQIPFLRTAADLLSLDSRRNGKVLEPSGNAVSIMMCCRYGLVWTYYLRPPSLVAQVES